MENIKSVVSDGKNATQLEQTIEGVAIERTKIDNLNAGCIHAGTIKLNSEGKPIFASDINFDDEREMKRMITVLTNEVADLKTRINELATTISTINSQNLNRREVL